MATESIEKLEDWKKGEPQDIEGFQELLKEGDTKYQITFGPHFANHYTQTLVALVELGAKASRLAEFAHIYGQDTGYGPLVPLAAAEVEVTADTLESHSHSRTQYAALRLYWQGVLRERSLKELLPQLFDRWSATFYGSAFHPMIQMGVGLRAGCLEAVAAGLAYMSDEPVEIHAPSPLPLAAPLTAPAPGRSLLAIAGEVSRSFPQYSRERAPAWSGFSLSQKMEAIRQDVGGQLLELLGQWQLHPEDPQQDLREVDLVAAAAYAGALPHGCDFFLLHGITSFWALKFILQLYVDSDRDFFYKLIRHHLFYFFLVYLAQKAPEPSLSAPAMQLSFAETLQRAMASNDEHLPKLSAALLNAALQNPSQAPFFVSLISHSLLTVVTPHSYIF